jgi:hypothetical protein
MYMRQALELLQNVRERKTIYLPGDIPGIGKNMLTDENRLKAIDAYSFFIRFVEYQDEKAMLMAGSDRPAILSANPEMRSHLEQYLTMLPEILRGTESSRERDIARGSAIIPDYTDTHPAVDEDPFVLQVRVEVDQEIRETEELLASL